MLGPNGIYIEYTVFHVQLAGPVDSTESMHTEGTNKSSLTAFGYMQFLPLRVGFI